MLRRCFYNAPHVVSRSAAMVTSAFAKDQKRFLKIAKSAFGFYLARRGQRKFPFLRRPHIKNTHAMNLSAPYFWSFMTAKSQTFFLPEENYITGDWTGKFFVSKRQVYTLQHATSGAKVRVKSFPSVFEFNTPSRWNIGKEMNTLTKPRMDLIDEQMLTKKQRLDYVKAGLLPNLMSYSLRNDIKNKVENVKRKLSIEIAKRKDLENALAQFRSHGSPSIAGLATRQTILSDIERLREEKGTIREWLERGVTEAERVSNQLTRLSEEIRQAELRESEVAQEVHEMNERYCEIQKELYDLDLHITSVQNRIVVREAETMEATLNNSLREEYGSILEKHVVAAKTVKELRNKLTLLETAQTTMECLAACSRRSLHELERLSAGVSDGSVCDDLGTSANDSDSFDSEDGDDNTKHPRVILTSAKTILDRSDSCLCTIWSGLCRIAFDQARLRRERDIQFHEARMVVERDLTMTVENCSAHLHHLQNEIDEWREKEQKFERLAQKLQSASQNNVLASSLQSEVNEDSNKDFEGKNKESTGSISEILKQRSKSLWEEHSRLKATNEALKNKLEGCLSDYESVRELKHAYRDLEIRKTELTHVNEGLRATNRLLKLSAWEVHTKA